MTRTYLRTLSLAGAALFVVSTASANPALQIPYNPSLNLAKLSGSARIVALDQLDSLKVPAAILNKVTAEDLKALDVQQLDQLYARLQAPTQEALLEGYHLGTTLTKIKSAGLGILINQVLQYFWKGKVFNQASKTLRNRFPQKRSDFLIDHLSVGQFDRTKVPQGGQGASAYYDLFPATLGYGESKIDTRMDRPSYVLDYVAAASPENVERTGYQKSFDYLSADVIQIRDEIREIRPGFYLGKAYRQKGDEFVLFFALQRQ